MSAQIRFARLALDQVAAELDGTALRNGYLTSERMRFLATKIRDSQQVYDTALETAGPQ